MGRVLDENHPSERHREYATLYDITERSVISLAMVPAGI